MGMNDKLFQSQMMVADYLWDQFPHHWGSTDSRDCRYFSFLEVLCFLTCTCILHNHLGIASDGLKGRVFEVSLADLQNDEVAFRKFKLITEDVQGKNCLTNFHGMDLTRDKMCSMVKKWQVILFLWIVLDVLKFSVN